MRRPSPPARHRPGAFVALIAALALIAAACGDDGTSETTAARDTAPATEAPPVTAAPPETITEPPPEPSGLRLELDGLGPLANGFFYEGWVIIDGAPVSTGGFNVDDAGNLIELDGAPVDGLFATDIDLSGATAIVITIEPVGDTDPGPSTTKYLAGAVVDGATVLSVTAEPALGDDFAGATGRYILATPSDGDGTNELSGIWFLEPNPRRPGLDLPVLPAGWIYEGWAVIDGIPVTTGRFPAPDLPDDFSGFSGNEGFPPLPGEDFLVNAPEGLAFPIDLSGMIAVISIEPTPDDGPAPFALKPLVGGIPADATDHTVYELANRSDGFPTGVATIEG
ncbi:MAG: hypothetical protein ACE5KX_00480 [Acidimicrobiia bacterium]